METRFKKRVTYYDLHPNFLSNPVEPSRARASLSTLPASHLPPNQNPLPFLISETLKSTTLAAGNAGGQATRRVDERQADDG